MSDEQPIWEHIAEHADSLPEEAIAGIPIDGAAQHDHYLYGSPKRPADESTRELVKGALDETRDLVRSLPEELFVLRKQVKLMADLLQDAMYAGELYTHSDKALEATWQDCRREVLAAYRTATSKGKDDA